MCSVLCFGSVCFFGGGHILLFTHSLHIGGNVAYIFTLDNNNDTTLPIYVPHIWSLGPNGRMIIFLPLRFFFWDTIYVPPIHGPSVGPRNRRQGQPLEEVVIKITKLLNNTIPTCHMPPCNNLLSVVPNLNAQGFLFFKSRQTKTRNKSWVLGREGGGLAEPKRHMGGILARRLGRIPPNNTRPSPT